MSNSIKWIASLRGLFVLFVFISHEFNSILDKSILLAIGKIGVAGFFLISGYLAMTSIEKRNSKQFLFNRFIRLYPTYWILLLMTIITAILTHQHLWSAKEILANMTFFHQYIGFNNIIGSSWMLSIMVVFFASLVLAAKKNKVGYFFVLFSIGAIVCGFLRYYFQKPFPTAIFLMSCMGFLGYFYHKHRFCTKNLHKLVIFEIVLAISGYLSYQQMLLFYEVAYNGAFLLFFIFSQRNLSITIFNKLGKLGFTFFLGAGIPGVALSYTFPILKSHSVIFIITHFALCIIFSYLVTRFIEEPIIQSSKQLEKKFK